MPKIRRWSAILVALVVVHDLDHVRQARAVSSELYGVGSIALVTGIVVLVLAIRNHPFAPAAAIAVGAVQVLGLTAVHIVPHWSGFSDPYPAAHVDVFSWIVLGAMMLTGAMLVRAGLLSAREPMTA